MDIKKASDISLADYRLKCLIYGQSGAGKTTFAGTFPKPLFIDCDRGILSLRSKEGIDYIDICEVESNQRWTHLMTSIRAAIMMEAYETLVLDSLTTASEFAMIYTQLANKRIGQKPNWDDWNGQLSRIAELIETLLSADKHVVCIAHEKMDKDELSGRVWALPLLTGKLAQRVSLYFDEVYHAETTVDTAGVAVYRLLAQPTGIYTAKSRLVSGEAYLDPDFESITKKAGL